MNHVIFKYLVFQNKESKIFGNSVFRLSSKFLLGLRLFVSTETIFLTREKIS